jgi:hypothetical protein
MSREHLAVVLERLRKDAKRAAPEIEPDPDPLLRLEAECDYLDTGIKQVVLELRGICSACCFEDVPENGPNGWSTN